MGIFKNISIFFKISKKIYFEKELNKKRLKHLIINNKLKLSPMSVRYLVNTENNTNLKYA